MLNKVCIQGNLGADPELKVTTGGLCHTKISVAVRRNYKNASGKYDVDWVDCLAFRAMAETICKYFRKGDMVVISGALQSSSYTDANGNRVYKTEVLVGEVNFCGSKEKPRQSEENIPPSAELPPEQFAVDNSDYPF